MATQQPIPCSEELYAAFDEINKFHEENPVLAKIIHEQVVAQMLKEAK